MNCNPIYDGLTPGTKVYQRKKTLIARLTAIDKLGGKCIKCGISDERVLVFDHIEARNVNPRAERDKSGYQLFMEVIRGSKLYQLLCANCHMIKTKENKEYLSNNGSDNRKT